MKQRVFITLLLPLLLAGNVFGCICSSNNTLKELADDFYEFSDLVFVGEVIDVDSIENSYTLRVYNVFKGSSEADIIKGKYFDSCSLIPDFGRWLIYAQVESGYINISQCSPSRSFERPERVFASDYHFPAPAKGERFEKWLSNYDIELLNFRKKALADLIEELKRLKNKVAVTDNR